MKLEKQLAAIIDILEGIKAVDIKSINVAAYSSVTDIMLIATATSSRHANAVAEHVLAGAKELNMQAIGVEGKGASDWKLIDLGDIVVHVFTKEAREYYKLEKLWETVPEHLLSSEH